MFRYTPSTPTSNKQASMQASQHSTTQCSAAQKASTASKHPKQAQQTSSSSKMSKHASKQASKHSKQAQQEMHCVALFKIYWFGVLCYEGLISCRHLCADPTLLHCDFRKLMLIDLSLSPHICIYTLMCTFALYTCTYTFIYIYICGYVYIHVCVAGNICYEIDILYLACR